MSRLTLELACYHLFEVTSLLVSRLTLELVFYHLFEATNLLVSRLTLELVCYHLFEVTNRRFGECRPWVCNSYGCLRYWIFKVTSRLFSHSIRFLTLLNFVYNSVSITSFLPFASFVLFAFANFSLALNNFRAACACGGLDSRTPQSRFWHFHSGVWLLSPLQLASCFHPVTLNLDSPLLVILRGINHILP